MKTIGLIGGMSWESTAEYYRIINEEVQRKLGGLHSAKCLLYSVDFSEIEQMQATGEWEQAGRLLGEAARSLEKAGADFIVICTNTMHKVINLIEERISIPVLHILDATAIQIEKAGIRKIGLLGTKYTLEQDFYISRLIANNLEVIVPEAKEREMINKIIFEELCLGIIEPASKDYYKGVIQKLVEDGAEGIILGCTEIGLLIKPHEVIVPLFDTSEIHAKEAVTFALEK
ncbi:aspartate/glutamate racemase family protein [Neobacillus niacini]|uniref:aspartate/glutamate racemase family protein n=1 Tax=Neobacillus niacini TaxID=86668 RepID=UPI0021CB8F04|nr:aspartate/glutamate racemase family protein [Neobacillus niacini]MCM3764432.1 aspartate/glutamate racemase family protein [Neobacillus niacini]